MRSRSPEKPYWPESLFVGCGSILLGAFIGCGVGIVVGLIVDDPEVYRDLPAYVCFAPLGLLAGGITGPLIFSVRAIRSRR